MGKLQAINTIRKLISCMERDTCENMNCVYYTNADELTVLLDELQKMNGGYENVSD